MARRTISQQAISVPSVFPGQPEEEKTEIYTIQDAMGEIHRLNDKVDGLEKIVRVFLLSNAPPIIAGARLERCACGRFASRKFEIAHPQAGTVAQVTCAVCEPNHTFTRFETTRVSQISYLNPDAIKFAQELNQHLESAHQGIH